MISSMEKLAIFLGQLIPEDTTKGNPWALKCLGRAWRWYIFSNRLAQFQLSGTYQLRELCEIFPRWWTVHIWWCWREGENRSCTLSCSLLDLFYYLEELPLKCQYNIVFITLSIEQNINQTVLCTAYNQVVLFTVFRLTTKLCCVLFSGVHLWWEDWGSNLRIGVSCSQGWNLCCRSKYFKVVRAVKWPLRTYFSCTSFMIISAVLQPWQQRSCHRFRWQNSQDLECGKQASCTVSDQ